MMPSAMLTLLFAAAVAGDVPRPEYPRPQFVRDQWQNLNGTWTCELETDKAEPTDHRDTKGLSQPITVPFCPESRLSGIGHTGFIPRIWYHRVLEIPAEWTERILLHFGGVAYHCDCFIDSLLDAGREVSSVSAPQANGVSLSLEVPDPKPWSPESPHLYDLRQGIELAQAAGFNGARLHQKVFEPRFHSWADRLGYLTWSEAASWGCGAAKPEGRDNFLREWRKIVERDRNHPSIIAWTPWNEVWATDNEAQIARTLRDTCALTRALDPTRPVHTSSGGAHVATDIWSVHCYDQTAAGLTAVIKAGEDATLAKVQRAHAEAVPRVGLPLFVGEFGGIKWHTPDSGAPPENWGYGDAPKNKEEFLRRLDDLVNAVLAVPGCAGYCYTQLTDVEQEVNGIYTYDRREKFDMPRIRAAFSREPGHQ